jgi:HK97 family phage portal protein
MSALRIGTVYACVRIIAETIASLPVHVYERQNGSRVMVESHPLNYLLSVTSNGEQTAMETREFVMTSLGLRGNAYCHVARSNRGGVAAITPLKPGYMLVSRDGAQRLIFQYDEPNNEGSWTESSIWRVAGLGSDGVTGLSPIALARETLGLSLSMERSANRIFANGAQSNTTLEFDHKLSEEQIDHLRGQWAENYAGWRNAGKPLILESGMKAKAIGMSNADAQFLESRKAQVAEIARWFRVPPHMVGDLDRATFSNIEHQSIEFVTQTIRPWLVRLEQTMARDLLGESERRRGIYVQHTVEGLLRGDIKTRYEAYSSAITNGWMSRNEVRRLENFNREDGLDDFMVPLNMGSAGESEPEGDPTEELAEAENRALRLSAGNLDMGDFVSWAAKYLQRREKVLSERLGRSFSGYAVKRADRMNTATTPLEAAHIASQTTIEDIRGYCNE